MEISKEVIAILDYLGAKFGVSIDWTSQNVMPYVQELAKRYIKYDIASSALFTAIFLLIDIAIIAISVKAFQYNNKKYEGDKWNWDIEERVIHVVVTVFIMIIPTVLICFGIDSVLRDIFIPELRLYELLKGMMK